MSRPIRFITTTPPQLRPQPRPDDTNLRLRVEDVLPVPEVLGELLGHQVALGREREEAVAALGVAAVPGRHVQLLQTLACRRREAAGARSR